MRPRRRGSSAPGSGFAIGGHSAYLEPMFEFCFPTKAASVPDRPNWLHEVKYDGYRLRLERDSDRVHTSRRTEGASATVSESLRGYLSSARDCQRSARRRLTCQNHHPPPPPPTFLEFSNVRHLCALHRRPSGPVLLSVERNGGCAGAPRGGNLRSRRNGKRSDFTFVHERLRGPRSPCVQCASSVDDPAQRRAHRPHLAVSED